MKEKLRKRLEELGVVLPVEDERLIKSLCKGAKRRLLAETGQYELPGALKPVMIDMAVGEYLLFRKSIGRLEGFDQEYAIRQMSQGDTSITYAMASEAQSPVDVLIERLSTPPAALITEWRRLRW
jgi:hypothetical protein